MISRSSFAQNPSITVKDNGLEFYDKSMLNTSHTSQNIGAKPIAGLYLSYSNGIMGGETLIPYEGTSKIISLNQENYRKLDASGLPLNPAKNKTFFFRKSIDEASVDLLTKFKTNSILDSLVFSFSIYTSSGNMSSFYKITLQSVEITNYATEVSYNKDSNQFQTVESIQVAYGDIIFEHVIEGESVTIPYDY